MTTFDRPPPDITKIIKAWNTWQAGGEALPGRTMADLKIGGSDKLLETIAADTDAVSPAYEAWMLWENGKSTPETALAELAAGGFADVVAALTD